VKTRPLRQSPLEANIMSQSLALDPFMTHDLISLGEKCSVEGFWALGLGGGCHGVNLGRIRGLFNSQFFLLT
jgi:hypothetical protein